MADSQCFLHYLGRQLALYDNSNNFGFSSGCGEAMFSEPNSLF